METKQNLFGIEQPFELVAAGLLEVIKVKETNSGRNIGKNVYCRTAIPNVVWMRVQKDYGIFINEKVTTYEGKTVNLVDELSKHYWFVDNTTGGIRCATLENRAIWRCIGSIILYGDIHKKMPRWLEVHHKWWRWCNLQETLSFVCHKKHKRFHDLVSTRKSHRVGRVVKIEQDFKRWLDEIQQQQKLWKNRKM